MPIPFLYVSPYACGAVALTLKNNKSLVVLPFYCYNMLFFEKIIVILPHLKNDASNRAYNRRRSLVALQNG